MVYLSFLLGVIAGLIGAHYARQRGRQPEIWFVIGLLFGLLGVFVLFLLPQLEKTEERKEQTPSLAGPDPRYQEWFFLDGGHHQQGPIPFASLIKAWQEKTVHSQTYVWTEGMLQWAPICQLPLLLDKLR